MFVPDLAITRQRLQADRHGLEAQRPLDRKQGMVHVVGCPYHRVPALHAILHGPGWTLPGSESAYYETIGRQSQEKRVAVAECGHGGQMRRENRMAVAACQNRVVLCGHMQENMQRLFPG